VAWYRRFWNALRPGRLQRDLEREMSFHIAERTDELQEKGLSREEALRQARMQFGSFATRLEGTRDMDINIFVESTIRNLRYAVRTLAKTPAFTLTVILTLALGIGANSAVFSAIDAVLLRPLPFPRGDELVEVKQSRPSSISSSRVVPTGADLPIAPARLEDWNRLNGTFEAITGYYSEDTSETTGDLPEKLRRAWVARRFLTALRIVPAFGRDFSADEQHFGGPAAVLISDRFWRRRFGANPDAIGKTLRVPNTAYTIVGVMPPSFQFPDRDVDLWSPSPPDAPFAQSRELTWFNVIGRLKPGVPIEQARADLAGVQSNLGRQYPKTDAAITTAVIPLKEARVGGTRTSLWLLFGSVSLLLLIACTNIAALLLSRSAAREHETSVRFSLGASRISVATQLLTEVLILAVAGALAGLFIAAGTSSVFSTLARDLPRVEEIHLNWVIVVYSLGCAVAVTLLCGIVPVIRGAWQSPADALAHGGRSQVSSRSPVQSALVAVQIALAVILLVGAGLLLRSFRELARVSPGFDPQKVLTFHISNTWAEAGGKAGKQRTDRILDALRSVPGVETVTTAMSLPGVPGEYQIEMKTAEGRAETEPKIVAQSRWVTPDYFATMRIPVVAGELCRDEPNSITAMVNRSFADRYLNGPAAAVGRRLAPADNPFNLPPADVRGIVGDARETGLDREAPPTAYWCAGSMQPNTFFLVRTSGELSSMPATIRRKVHEIEPRRSVYDLTPLTEHISDGYAENRLRMTLLASFALTAIALAAIGLYGTLSYLVNVRRREVALRMTLGALRSEVVRRVVNQGLRISVLGCAIGLALAAAFTRFLSSMLYGVSSTDLATLGAVTALVLAVSILASLLPAIRAAGIEPIVTLREE
jgi:putative ABC transport system permease protein